MPGALRNALPDPHQHDLLQHFLDVRAVSGSNATFCSLGLSPEELTALRALATRGWVRQHPPGQDDIWQLTTKPLDHIKIQFGLQCPFSVFRRRANIPLENATAFELALELQASGFKHKESKSVRKKKSVSPLTSGA